MACSLSILGWSAAVPRERRKLFPNVPSRSTTSVDKLFNSGAIGFSFPHEVNPQLRSNCILDGLGDPIKRQIHFSFKRYLIFETTVLAILRIWSSLKNTNGMADITISLTRCNCIQLRNNISRKVFEWIP